MANANCELHLHDYFVFYPYFSACLVDVAFIMDASGSITREFLAEKRAVNAIVNSTDIAPDMSRAALIYFSDKTRVIDHLECMKPPLNFSQLWTLYPLLVNWTMPGQYYLFWQASFMVDRTKQPEGCIGISEKCVFTLQSLSSRYQELPKRFIRAIVVLQLLLLNLKSFQKMLQVEL